MDSERFRRVKAIFHDALEKKPEELAAFLDEACKDDPELRAEVETLLSADEEGDEYLEALIPPDTPPLLDRAGYAGTHIGPYLLRRALAEDEIGTEYEAVHEQSERKVALKVLKAGVACEDALPNLEERTRKLLGLKHAAIVPWLDSGMHVPEGDDGGGVPFFTRKFLPYTMPITDYAWERKLSIGDRLLLFRQLLDALHYGHEKGIVHRGLSPASVRVNPLGKIKLLDFGIAQAVDSDLADMVRSRETVGADSLGPYLAPEQCAEGEMDPDLRCDIYSSAVVLFELLCGMWPYALKNPGPAECLQAIQELAPIKACSLRKDLRADMDWILGKALRKNPDERYASIADFRRDIEEYQACRPISVRKAGTLYRLGLLFRRAFLPRQGK
jgi:serine/threonine-protein kinase